WEHRHLWTRFNSKQTLMGHTDPIQTGRVNSVAWSPDGKLILTGSGELGKPGEATVWDAQKGQEILSLKGHTDSVTSVAFSLDNNCIDTGSEEQIARVWDSGKGKEVLSPKGHTQPLSSVAFSPDGKRILTGSNDTTAKVWDAQKGQEILSLEGHT